MPTITAFTPRALGAVALAAALAGDPAAAQPNLHSGPFTCKSGYVWREAFPGDVVCVDPRARDAVRAENAAGPRRRSPSGGAYGVNACLPGAVWREAAPHDLVCVDPGARDRVRGENAGAIFQLVSPASAPEGPVQTSRERHQLGSHLYVQGRGFSPNGDVAFYALGPAWSGPYSLGRLRAGADGAIARGRLHDARCRGPGASAVVVALDQRSGRVIGAGGTNAFAC